ncbi:MAG: TAXI family TRAP transporter solute-binding subunit [Synergistaceae bacterium]|jgi:TRAP transporter TAXI family solute receptor|nr:TAXI family TRAP transporter solute-binding subunit [Synergistaceae bacterium]
MKGTKGVFAKGLLAAALMVFASGVASAADDVFVRIGTSTVGGGFYLIGNTIARLGTQALKEINFTAITGGSIKNCINLGAKEIELGMVQSSTVNDAWKGGNDSFKEPVKTLRYVTAIYLMPAHILVNKDAEIKSIADFKGKRVDYGSVGAGIEINTREFMSVYGLKDDDVNIQRFSRNEVEEALRVGDSQAHIWTTNAPNAQVSEMVRSGKVGLIGIEDDKIGVLIEKFPHYEKAVIPGGTYEGYAQDIPVAAAVGSLLTYEDMPEDVIYKITKMLHENNKFLAERLNYFAGFNLQMALAGMAVPLHPGAKKYYVEQGLIQE